MTTLKDIDITDAEEGAVESAEAEKESPKPAPAVKRNAPQQESEAAAAEEPPGRRGTAWLRLSAYRVLPALALLLAAAAGYLNATGASGPDASALRDVTTKVGSDDAVALLSYHAASVDKDLSGASDRLTGDFKDAYSALIRQVVIPGAKEKQISVVARVAAAASVSATESHAVVLVFVNQTVTIGEGRPTDTAPVVKVVLEKVNGRWLVSHFDPV